MQPAVEILGVPVSAVNMEQAVSTALELSSRAHSVFGRTADLPGPYFTVTGVHGIIEAQSSDTLHQIFRSASLVLPDGMPTVWLGKAVGFRRMSRVYGPEFMWNVIAASAGSEVGHFLLGGKDGVAELLKSELLKRHPDSKIVGCYTPPFRDLNAEEEATLLNQLLSARPHIVWIGLSTPKQEMWMRRWTQKYPYALFVGVGAAFDINSGLVADAPRWMKVSGLQWFHRLLQEPRRLWRRYLYVNPKFIFSVLLRWPKVVR